MPLKNFKPTSPSRRSLVLVDRSELIKEEPLFGGKVEAIKEITG